MNPEADQRLARSGVLKTVLRRPELGAVAGTILVFAFFGVVAGDSGMFSARGVANFLEVSAQLGILAVAAALLMIGGEFDLSIGSMIGFAGVVIALAATELEWPMWACVVLAFASAVVVGAFNGFIVVRTNLPSFIVTLAMLFILRGLTIGGTRFITGRTQVSGLKRLMEGGLAEALFYRHIGEPVFTWLASIGVIATRPDGLPVVPGVPIAMVWWVLLVVLATWVLLRTPLGNWIFAVGGDVQAARNAGVPVLRVKILLFIGTASAATLFAALQVFDAGSADTSRGLLKEFEAIIAAVIGGTLLTGGYGSAIGAAFGALIFGVVQMGIFYTGVNTDWFKVFLGVMMLVAVLVNDLFRRRVTESG